MMRVLRFYLSDKKSVVDAAAARAKAPAEAKHVAAEKTAKGDDPYANVELPSKNENASNNITTVYGDIVKIGQLPQKIAYIVDVVCMKRLGAPLRPKVTLSCLRH